jgi:predicted unusual protein kinase regulating ubiquinone biosynthesis (AarF/ABC1/UbiB family)
LYRAETRRWAAAAEWALARGGWRTTAAARAGSVVAVKVRHPGVEQAINVDFLILECAARCLHALLALRDLQIPETVEQFRVHMAGLYKLS